MKISYYLAGLLFAISSFGGRGPLVIPPIPTFEIPDSSRFSTSVLTSGFNEPMGMAILPNYDVVVAERKGAVRYFSQATNELKTISRIPVFSGIEDGLLGVAVDPGFAKNHWIYFYFGLAGERNVSQLARYELINQKLVSASKKVLLEIPTQRTYCCHSAGYLTFGSDGLLYLSTGDNTNAEEIEGHNPTDERPGRQLSDDQASTANSNDYRGKILRIRPEPDGTYSIPDGNLFPKDGSEGKPEIYAMGLRNPFRISVDPKTHYVYWGDVGPDTEVAAEEGKLSYDEINQARKPGFFGYPYFLGANEAFPKYDFATKLEGPKQDPQHPVNLSPHNTGIRDLPPAQPAFIWYGKGPSRRWPLVGKGSASAMAGPVYYSDLYADAPYKLPDYYNGNLFIYDYIRKWIMAVTMDQNGNYERMEPFLSHLKIAAPIDMQFAPDGSIYLLAYGSKWFAQNTDSGLIRVEYASGNRKPLAKATINRQAGAAPLKVLLSATGSFDYDSGDVLSYQWKIGSEVLKGRELEYVFTKPGIYTVVLSVTDQHGATGTMAVPVRVGNTPPEVSIQTSANRSFYWNNTVLDYAVKVRDKEDKPVDLQRASVTFRPVASVKDIAAAFTSGQSDSWAHAKAPTLYASQDCSSCHLKDSASIGPALVAVARRYRGQSDAAVRLADKIIKGGSGNWGTYAMPPHAALTPNEARDLANYILSMDKKQEKLPLSGKIRLSEQPPLTPSGAYVLVARYTDKGAHGVEPLSSNHYLKLRNPLVQAEDFDGGEAEVVSGHQAPPVAAIKGGGYMRFDAIDLTGIRKLRLRCGSGARGTIELRGGSRQGPVMGSIDITSPAGNEDQCNDLDMSIIPSNITQDLFFLFKNTGTNLPLHIDSILFEK